MKESLKKFWIRIIAIIVIVAFFATGVGIIGYSFFG